MDWNDAANKGGQGFEDKIKMEEGTHDPVTIIKAIHFKNDGTEMMDFDDNPASLVVFANDDGHEHVQFFSLAGQYALLSSLHL